MACHKISTGVASAKRGGETLEPRRHKRGRRGREERSRAIRSKLTIDSSETAAWHDPLPRSFPEIDDSVDVKIQSQKQEEGNKSGTRGRERASVYEPRGISSTLASIRRRSIPTTFSSSRRNTTPSAWPRNRRNRR